MHGSLFFQIMLGIHVLIIPVVLAQSKILAQNPPSPLSLISEERERERKKERENLLFFFFFFGADIVTLTHFMFCFFLSFCQPTSLAWLARLDRPLLSKFCCYTSSCSFLHHDLLLPLAGKY